MLYECYHHTILLLFRSSGLGLLLASKSFGHTQRQVIKFFRVFLFLLLTLFVLRTVRNGSICTKYLNPAKAFCPTRCTRSIVVQPSLETHAAAPCGTVSTGGLWYHCVDVNGLGAQPPRRVCWWRVLISHTRRMDYCLLQWLICS